MLVKQLSGRNRITDQQTSYDMLQPEKQMRLYKQTHVKLELQSSP